MFWYIAAYTDHCWSHIWPADLAQLDPVIMMMIECVDFVIAGYSLPIKGEP